MNLLNTALVLGLVGSTAIVGSSQTLAQNVATEPIATYITSPSRATLLGPTGADRSIFSVVPGGKGMNHEFPSPIIATDLPQLIEEPSVPSGLTPTYELPPLMIATDLPQPVEEPPVSSGLTPTVFDQLYSPPTLFDQLYSLSSGIDFWGGTASLQLQQGLAVQFEYFF